MLEKHTERLSELTEKDTTDPTDRTHVVNLTRWVVDSQHIDSSHMRIISELDWTGLAAHMNSPFHTHVHFWP